MKTKLLLTSAVVLLSAANIFAQATANQTSSPFIFPEFTTGTVFQKNGATLEALLDYNTVKQEMMFDQNGQKLVLDDVSNIDSIIIQNVVLVPAKNGFFEKLTKTPIALYAQYRGKIVKGDPLSGRIGTSNSTLNGTVGGKTSDANTPGNYEMKLPQGYMMDTQVTYWLKNGNDYKQLSNLKGFSKQFPGKEGKIDAFIKENNIKPDQINDLIKLIEFSNK